MYSSRRYLRLRAFVDTYYGQRLCNGSGRTRKRLLPCATGGARQLEIPRTNRFYQMKRSLSNSYKYPQEDSEWTDLEAQLPALDRSLFGHGDTESSIGSSARVSESETHSGTSPEGTSCSSTGSSEERVNYVSLPTYHFQEREDANISELSEAGSQDSSPSSHHFRERGDVNLSELSEKRLKNFSPSVYHLQTREGVSPLVSEPSHCSRDGEHDVDDGGSEELSMKMIAHKYRTSLEAKKAVKALRGRLRNRRPAAEDPHDLAELFLPSGEGRGRDSARGAGEEENDRGRQGRAVVTGRAGGRKGIGGQGAVGDSDEDRQETKEARDIRRAAAGGENDKDRQNSRGGGVYIDIDNHGAEGVGADTRTSFPASFLHSCSISAQSEEERKKEKKEKEKKGLRLTALKKAASAGDFAIVELAIRQRRQSHLSLHPDHFHCLITAYVTADRPEEAELALRRLQAEGFPPRARSYSLLTQLCVQRGHLRSARAALQEMLRLEAPGPERTDCFNHLFRAYCRSPSPRALAVVQQLEQQMLESNTDLDALSCHLLVKFYTAVERVEEAERVLARARNTMNVGVGVRVYSMLVKAYAHAGDLAGMNNVLKRMQKYHIKPNAWVWKHYLVGLAQLGMVEEAQAALAKIERIADSVVSREDLRAIKNKRALERGEGGGTGVAATAASSRGPPKSARDSDLPEEELLLQMSYRSMIELLCASGLPDSALTLIEKLYAREGPFAESKLYEVLLLTTTKRLKDNMWAIRHYDTSEEVRLWTRLKHVWAHHNFRVERSRKCLELLVRFHSQLKMSAELLAVVQELVARGSLRPSLLAVVLRGFVADEFEPGIDFVVEQCHKTNFRPPEALVEKALYALPSYNKAVQQTLLGWLQQSYSEGAAHTKDKEEATGVQAERERRGKVSDVCQSRGEKCL